MAQAINMQQITKRFGNFTAIDSVDFSVKKGEIHALLGENGAGKSTLMSVLFGLYPKDAGEIFIHEKQVDIKNPNDANALGIGMVHQHFKLVHNFTVLESVVLGHEDTRHGFLFMDQAREKLLNLSEQFNFRIDPDARISNITVGMQQRVEILKMLYCDNDILIFDEPTAVLTPQEIIELMEIMRRLAAEGKSIVFISHKLKEIKAVADRCTILRRGRKIGTIDVADSSPEKMSEMMVGRKIEMVVNKDRQEPGEVVLSVEKLNMVDEQSQKKTVKDVSFQVRGGEIVCIAGIDGNGQSELIYGLSGLQKIESGKITLNGKSIEQLKVRERTLSGMAHVPEDRHRFGLVLDYNLEQNLLLQRYFEDRFQKHGFIKFSEIRQYAEELVAKYDIRSSIGVTSPARSMSGGNQQKAIIARELDHQADLIMAVQPVRGLDVGAIEYIHQQLLAQRAANKAILMVSFELEEVMNLADRILVMYEGKIVADLNPDTIDIQELGLYMAGQKRREADELT